MPKVSVVVPVYNAEHYLVRCIESIQHQIEKDIEIILVDDGSSDDSLQICQKYADADERIVVLAKENGGPHSTRKVGINAATAEYVTFADADDWMQPTLISDMLFKIKEYQTDGVVCGYSLYEKNKYTVCVNCFSSGKYNKRNMIDMIYSQMLCPNNTFIQKLIPALWGKLFKRGLLLNIMNDLDEDICIGEDLACTYKYMLLSDSIYIANENIDYIYCMTDESNTTRYDEKYFDKSIRSSDFLYNAINELGFDFLKENIDRYRLYQLYRLIGIAVNTNNWNQYKRMICDIENISTSKEYRQVFESIDLKHFKSSIIDRWLLQCLKEKNHFFFEVISLGLYGRNKIRIEHKK